MAEIIGKTFLHNLAVLNADNPICKAGNVVVVGNHHNSLPELRTGALDKPQHLGAGLAVKVAGRLVGQHDSRFGNQGAGDSHTLLLSAGKIVRHIFQFIFQPQQVNDCLLYTS